MDGSIQERDLEIGQKGMKRVPAYRDTLRTEGMVELLHTEGCRYDNSIAFLSLGVLASSRYHEHFSRRGMIR